MTIIVYQCSECERLSFSFQKIIEGFCEHCIKFTARKVCTIPTKEVKKPSKSHRFSNASTTSSARTKRSLPH